MPRQVLHLAVETTRLGDRLLLTGAIGAVMALIYFGMWRGWRRVNRDPIAVQARPEGWQSRFAAEGIYASTTFADAWLRRVPGLGARARVRVEVGIDGLLIVRGDAKEMFIPRASIESVDLAPGHAGKVVGGRGVVVVTWLLAGQRVQTGILPDPQRRSEVVASMMGLIS